MRPRFFAAGMAATSAAKSEIAPRTARIRSEQISTIDFRISSTTALLALCLTFAPMRGNAGGTSPDLQLTKNDFQTAFGPGNDLILQSHDDRPIKITRVVINRHYGDENCDFSKSINVSALPTTMRFSDTIDLGGAAGLCGLAIEILILTDLGPMLFTFK